MKGKWQNGMAVVAVLAMVLVLGACRSSRQTAPAHRVDVATGRHYVETVIARAPALDCINAKMRFALHIGGKELAVGGNLRMKKNEVIQLSLVGFGIIEGGRLEFTPDSVLLVDRINHRYVSAGYDELSFLREAEVDFYTLQALFWNQLVEPGTRQATVPDASAFRLERTPTEVVLTGTKGRKLVYRFHTLPADGSLARTRIEAARGGSPYRLDWSYGNFVPVGASRFPQQMDVVLTGLRQPASLSLALSRLSTDEGWSKRTSVSRRYQRVEVEELLQMLMK